MSSQLSLGKYIKFRHICMLFLLSKDLLNWQADAQNPHGRPVQYQGSDVSEECIQGGGGGGGPGMCRKPACVAGRGLWGIQHALPLGWHSPCRATAPPCLAASLHAFVGAALGR